MDIASMLKQLQAQKPPVECPVCGKLYRSFSGISYHVVKFHSNGPAINNMAVTPTSSVQHVKKQPLSYAEAQRMVEFDIKGSIFRNLITEPLFIEIELEKETIEVEEETLTLPVKCPSRPTPKKKGRGRSSRFVHYKHRYHDFVKRTLHGGTDDKKSSLPVASFTVIPEDDVIESEVPQRSSYYRFIEKSTDELDEEVEYGMDEEDYIWLEQVNEERKDNNLASVSQEVFEMLMDRLEKESHFETRTVTGDPYNLIDEDAVCSICVDGECSNSNVILFCDMCNLAVHQECYGVPYIPEGQWLCRKCLQSPSKPVDCVLCPTKSGAFKQTDTGEWAHVVCALWIPEVCFANTVFLEPIDSIRNIPAARWKLVCYICKKKEGACIQCFKSNCYTAFHVTCAQQGGLYMRIEPGRTETGAPTVKKSAYCDIHIPKKIASAFGTPCNSDYCSEDDSDTGSLHSPLPIPVIPGKSKSPLHQNPSAKLKEVQKKLLEKESFKLPAVHIPFVPAHRLSKIVVKVAIAKKSQFIQQLQSYWMLKRQSRNGVPLLRRLQVNTGSGHCRNQREELTIEEWSQSKELKEQLRYWQQLRHDLERVRLLIELIRKREKVKKDQYRMKQQVVHMQLKPLQMEMERTLMLLQERDTTAIFAEPVKADDAPDYHEFISYPMDFSTMRQKLSDYEYLNFDLFETDFKHIIQNCLDFNKEDTVYYRAAVRMRSQCKTIIKSAKKRIKQAGIDPQTGMHMEKPPPIAGDSTTTSAEEDVSTLIENPFMTIDEKIEDLEQKLDIATTIKSALSRLARQKMLRKEIAKLRRQKRKMDTPPTNSSTEPEVTTTQKIEPHKENLEVPHKKRGRKRKNGFIQSLHQLDSSYNGEVKIEPQQLSIELRIDQNTSNQVHLFLENGEHNFDRLSTLPLLHEQGKIVRNPSPGRSRRSGILFKKKQYQPTKPSPLVLYSSTTSEDDQAKSLKIRLRLEPNPIETKSSPPYTENQIVNNDRLNGDVDSNNDSPTKIVISPSTDAVRLKDHAIFNGFVNFNGSSLEGDQEECFTDNDNDIENYSEMFEYSSRKRTYTSSSGNSDSEGAVTHRRKSHKRGRQKGGKISLKQEFGDLEGLDDIKYGVYMVYSDETHLLDPKTHPETLEMLTLIWAKCKGYPSYPALTMDPNLPRTGYQANGVPIPIPTIEILQMNDDQKKYLILFFDARRTWQWLPREKIEPLGVDSRLDEVKLIQSRKPSMRKNVQEAYKRAISFRRRLEIGENSEEEVNRTNIQINGSGTNELVEILCGGEDDDFVEQLSSVDSLENPLNNTIPPLIIST